MASDSPLPPPPPRPPHDDDDIPGHPAWKRKLEPRKGKGLTPNKLDVIFVAPDGEEIKTKRHLQRYLKAHPGGPALSEFNWNTGETPRRSSRLTSKIPVETTEAQTTSKRSKRNIAQNSQDQDKEEDAASRQSKRARKKGKDTTPDEVVGDSAAVSGMEEEVMHDVEKNENTLSLGEGIVDISATNGDLNTQGKAEAELAVIQENAKDKSVEVEKIDEASGEQDTKHEEIVVEDNIVYVSGPVSLLAQKTDDVPKLMTLELHNTQEEIKDKHLENGSAECEQEEPLEPLSSKSVEFTVEVLNGPQVQDSIEVEKEEVEKIPEEGLPKKDEELESGDFHHAGNSCFAGDDQDKSASQEAYHSSQPVGVTN